MEAFGGSVVYLWTAIASDTAGHSRNLGISGDASAARAAASACLRDGSARLAFVETAITVTEAHTLSRCYAPTCAGWWATPSPDGEVRWTRFTGREAAAGLRALAGAARGQAVNSMTAAGRRGLLARCAAMHELDQMTGQELAARYSSLQRELRTARPGTIPAAAVAAALNETLAETIARARTCAVHAGRLLACSCGFCCTGLAAMDEHLQRFPMDSDVHCEATGADGND